MFIGPSVKVYGGHDRRHPPRDNDLVVNPNKAKKLTNIRTTAADEKLVLAPPRQLTLEYALEFINDDELVEVTPEIDPPAQVRPRPQRAQAVREEAVRGGCLGCRGVPLSAGAAGRGPRRPCSAGADRSRPGTSWRPP